MTNSYLINDRRIPNWLLAKFTMPSSDTLSTHTTMNRHRLASPADSRVAIAQHADVGAPSNSFTSLDRSLFPRKPPPRNPRWVNKTCRIAVCPPKHELDPASSAAFVAADVNAPLATRRTAFTYEDEGVSTVAAVATPSREDRFQTNRPRLAGQFSGPETDSAAPSTSIRFKDHRRQRLTAALRGTTQGGAAVLSPP